MITSGIDRIVVAVSDLGSASAEFAKLLNQRAVNVDRAGEAWFVMRNTVLVLRQSPEAPGRVVEVTLALENAAADTEALANERDLPLSICSPDASARLRADLAPAREVDHLVLRTASAEGCVALFRDQLGMRLALDQTVPEWGGRMLFFRCGKLTLEVIETADKAPSRDYFWGLALACENLAQEADRLRAEGVQLSSLRDGRKPGTRVATVKSHTQGLPTLLIAPC